MKRVDLRKEYKEIIDQMIDQTFIDDLQYELEFNVRFDSFNDMVIGSVFLGRIDCVLPSGKIYAFWTTNQTWRDEVKDQLFMELLEAKAEQLGCFITQTENSDLCLEKELDIEFIEQYEFVSKYDRKLALNFYNKTSELLTYKL